MAALIAWMPVVRVDDLVKDRRPPKAAALRAVLDKIINTNRVLSKRSRPLSRPQTCTGRSAAAVVALLLPSPRDTLTAKETHHDVDRDRRRHAAPCAAVLHHAG